VEYPSTERKEIIDEIHNKKLSDPYRWLENFDDEEVQQWLNIQHNYTENILGKIPNRDEAIVRIKELLSLGEISAPKKKNNKYFFQKRTTENQPILFVQDESGDKRELVNPNILSKENPVAMDWYYISPSANFIVYGLSKNGDEWSILHIMNTNTREILSERIPRTRFCSLAWMQDETGFYYTRYPLPGTVPSGQENYNKHIYFHKIGTNWQNDLEIFGEGRDPTNHYAISLSKDGRYLLINIIKYTKNDLYLMDLKNKNKLIEVIANQDNLTSASIFNDTLWILTDRDHPKKTVCKVSLNAPQYENWQEVIPESDQTINQVLITKERIFLNVMKNASDYLLIYDQKGKFLSEISLPKYINIFDFADSFIEADDISEFYFGIRSFLYPTNIYHYNIETNELKLIDDIQTPVKPENYIVKQVWYESKDKTKVSMFLAYKKDLKLDGSNPTLLCGYGGFNIAIKPPYLKLSRFYWLEKGGIIAIANLRGGSEYGEDWHRDGMLEKKQNVFDDFIYAGKWLIENNYCSTKTLGIFGRSNGGLLTGAAVTQAPELFGAAYVGVPLLDMIRYHLFSIARYWIPEYGSSENSEQFNYILKYSPYQNVKKDTKYPPTFLVAAASDSRVDPNHAMKMTAMMQWANQSKEPIILYVERQAGHGVGKPLDKLAETEADLFTFVGWKTGLKM